MPKKGEKPTEKQLAALKAHQKPFKQGEARTSEAGAKGGKKQVKNGQEEYEKKTFAQHLAEELEILNADGKPRKKNIAKGLVDMLEDELSKKKPNAKAVNAIFQAIRDTIGEKPTDKVALDQDKPFEITVTVKS